MPETDSYITLLKRSESERIISEIRAGTNAAVHPDLFDRYARALHGAVDGVLHSEGAGDKYFDLQQKLALNANRFAAAKAFQATQLARHKTADGGGTGPAEKKAAGVLGAFDRWLATERNTAVARTRTAKQWNDFTDDSVKNQLYPNLKWIPSRSAHQREEHIPYYNRVWAKDDPFWRTNQPGSLWNCKCDWIETDEPANGLNAAVKPAKGLGGNPALTGELFSPDASYFTEKAQKAIFDVSYPDRLSRLQISVAADKYEIGDNIRTGRILLENFKEMQLAIRPHNRNQLNGPVKNPEYTLNGMIADAKRINSWNVARNFRSAIKQGAKVVIIDLFNMQRRELSANTLAKNIVQRHPDFTGGKIDSCYIVWKNKSIVLHNDLFHKYTDFKQHNYIIEIEEKIKELI